LSDLPTNAEVQGQSMSQDRITFLEKCVYAQEIIYYMVQSSLKCSILAFYWRLFRITIIRYPIVIVSAITAAWFVASVSSIARRKPVLHIHYQQLLTRMKFSFLLSC